MVHIVRDDVAAADEVQRAGRVFFIRHIKVNPLKKGRVHDNCDWPRRVAARDFQLQPKRRTRIAFRYDPVVGCELSSNNIG